MLFGSISKTRRQGPQRSAVLAAVRISGGYPGPHYSGQRVLTLVTFPITVPLIVIVMSMAVIVLVSTCNMILLPRLIYPLSMRA